MTPPLIPLLLLLVVVVAAASTTTTTTIKILGNRPSVEFTHSNAQNGFRVPHDVVGDGDHASVRVTNNGNDKDAIISSQDPANGALTFSTSSPVDLSYTLSSSKALLSPLPRQIKQLEDQFLVFEYPLLEVGVKTTVKMPTARYEVLQGEAFKVEEDKKKKTLTFERHPSTSTSTTTIKLRMEWNRPVQVFPLLDREVEVSFWGNVAFEEHYELVNAGAELDGGFSRLDYQTNQKNKPRNAGHWVKSVDMAIPSTKVNDIHYRDIIGNISTSNVLVQESSGETKIELRPRFPLFGGWKTEYYLSYNVPLSEMVYHDSNRGVYVLKGKINNPTKDSVVEKLKQRFILPQGSRVNKATGLSSSSSSSEVATKTRYTYLDSPTIGRPVVEMEFAQVPDTTEVEYEIEFELDTGVEMWRKPIMLSMAFMGVYVVAIVFSRW